MLSAIGELLFWVLVIVSSAWLLVHEAKTLANLPSQDFDWRNEEFDAEEQNRNRFIRSHHLTFLIASAIGFLAGIALLIIRGKQLFD